MDLPIFHAQSSPTRLPIGWARFGHSREWLIFVKIPTINKLISSVFYLTCADELLDTLQAVSYNVSQKICCCGWLEVLR